MLNSKQRAWLRSMANSLDCRFHIGKGELDLDLVRSLDELLSTHELVKINVLKTAESDVKTIADQLSGRVNAEVVQVIGRRIILYRFSEKLTKAGKNLTLPG